ncbi:MAG: hypothetical protein NC335_10830 [Bacteroides sp.]|nr:hypothetical protein [Bacteroides sp.]
MNKDLYFYDDKRRSGDVMTHCKENSVEEDASSSGVLSIELSMVMYSAES